MPKKPNPAPDGVRAIAALFAICAAYLVITGLLILMWPGSMPMSSASPLLQGFEQSGPYMFLLIAAVAGAIAWGLIRLNNLIRRIAILIAIAGVVLLVPSVSGATVMAQPKQLALGGLGIIVRVIVVWYLWREEVSDQFKPTQ